MLLNKNVLLYWVGKHTGTNYLLRDSKDDVITYLHHNWDRHG